MIEYSFGVGDRFERQGRHQLMAFIEAAEMGIRVLPVWNKSFREHKTVGSHPESVRAAVESAVNSCGYKGTYKIDADHITYDNVDDFIKTSDFFTIDIANELSNALNTEESQGYLKKYADFLEPFTIQGIGPFEGLSKNTLLEIGNKFYKACKEAARIRQKIMRKRGDSTKFLIEISIDEVEKPQSPLELFFILKFLADFQVPVNTIAPKFIGDFFKGIDYQGDVSAFEKDFEAHLLVIKHGIEHFGLPRNLRLSIHTGSDKFSLYPIMNRQIKKHGVGLHLKTAGTTWLEEFIGVAESGVDGLEFAKEVTLESFARIQELTGAYANVVKINVDNLPSENEVSRWQSGNFVQSLTHDQDSKEYNPDLRQLVHTAYKLAAERKGLFVSLLESNSDFIGEKVKNNILKKHIIPLFK